MGPQIGNVTFRKFRIPKWFPNWSFTFQKSLSLGTQKLINPIIPTCHQHTVIPNINSEKKIFFFYKMAALNNVTLLSYTARFYSSRSITSCPCLCDITELKLIIPSTSIYPSVYCVELAGLLFWTTCSIPLLSGVVNTSPGFLAYCPSFERVSEPPLSPFNRT